VIRVRDRIVGEGRLQLERLLVVADASILTRFGLEVQPEPVYALPSAWIDPAQRAALVDAGGLAFDPISIVGSHVAETVRRYASELVGRQELQTMLEHLRATMPALVKEIGTDVFPLGSLHRAYMYLLREGAWPRDPVAVLQAMLEAPTRDPRELAEAARRAILPDALRRRGTTKLEPLLLDPEYERELVRAWTSPGVEIAPDPERALALRDAVEAYAARMPRDRAAVVCTAALRPVLADFLIRSGIRTEVLAYGELPAEMQLVPAQVVNQERRPLAV
jgi:flagellar biosynthesis protein FlhA